MHVQGIHDWEVASDYYWITHAVDLLLSTIDEDELVRKVGKKKATLLIM
jgi:hypothetical protein